MTGSCPTCGWKAHLRHRATALGIMARRLIADQRGSLPSDLAKAAIAIAVLSVAAAHVLATQSGHAERGVLAEMARLASAGRNVGAAMVDPGATGSLVDRARRSQIDPCIAPPRR